MKHLKLLSLLFAMLLSMPIITSCSEDEGDTTCLISVRYGEGGTATTSDTEVMSGCEVTLTATPNEDYGFVNWTVDGVEVSKENPYTATITSNTEFVANFKKTKGEENGYTWIDLDLPSGIKWATCNVGATMPEGYGDSFAWGETTKKMNYSWSTYKYCLLLLGSTSMIKYCISASYGTVDNKTTLELSDDAAHVNWGGSWRMPTKSEQDELRNTDNCTWEWTTQNGVNGYKVTSKKNGNSIFLPAAGYIYNSNRYSGGSSGNYWSSSLDTIDSSYAFNLNLDSDGVTWGDYGIRFYGLSVRAVCP